MREMPDLSRMCLTITAPPWSRVRHWSAPHKQDEPLKQCSNFMKNHFSEWDLSQNLFSLPDEDPALLLLHENSEGRSHCENNVSEKPAENSEDCCMESIHLEDKADGVSVAESFPVSCVAHEEENNDDVKVTLRLVCENESDLTQLSVGTLSESSKWTLPLLNEHFGSVDLIKSIPPPPNIRKSPSLLDSLEGLLSNFFTMSASQQALSQASKSSSPSRSPSPCCKCRNLERQRRTALKRRHHSGPLSTLTHVQMLSDQRIENSGTPSSNGSLLSSPVDIRGTTDYHDCTNPTSNQDIFERLHATTTLPEALPEQPHQVGYEKIALPNLSQDPDDTATIYKTRRSSLGKRHDCHDRHDQRPDCAVEPSICLTEKRRSNSSTSSLPMQFLFGPLHRLYSVFHYNRPKGAKKKRGRETKRRPKSTSGWFGPASIFWILISTISLLTTSTTAMVCDSLTIYSISHMRRLENCTVIEGSLSITSMFSDMFSNKTEEFRFPKLREITDYLLICQVEKWFRSLETIFPNLSVIRGNRLVKDYALLIREVKGMENIGLPALTHIMRGGVYINRNSDLCYVDTINWKSIVAEKYHHAITIDMNSFMNKNCLKKCPLACADNNYCWSETHCQRLSVACPNNFSGTCYRNGTKESSLLVQCSKECQGGCSGPGPEDCSSCLKAKKFKDYKNENGKCISKCPEPSLLFENWRCISAEECRKKSVRYTEDTIDKQVFYKSYDGKCLETCPEETNENVAPDGRLICEACKNCTLECRGITIASLEEIQSLKGCTIIKGDLIIRINGERVVEELTNNLNRVKIITGSLKISRSFPIVSLDFFQSLEEIQGIHLYDSKEKTQYSLTIIENENLQKLFPTLPNGKQVQIKSRNGEKGTVTLGKASIFYNPKLCVKEIRNLVNKSGLEHPGDNSTSFATNGDKAVCGDYKLNLTLSFPGTGENATISTEKHDKHIVVEFTNFLSELTKNRIDRTRSLLGYELHFRKIDKITYEERNLSKYGGRDGCGNDEWEVIDHQPSEPAVTDKGITTYPSEVTFIPVRPYTYYAVYVTTVMIKDLTDPSGIDGAQSDIVYVLTPEDYPTMPENIVWTNLNYSAVNITWDPPTSPNGIIHHYDIILTLNQLNLTKLSEIDYCEDSNRKRSMGDSNLLPKPSKPQKTGNVTGDCSCDCTQTCSAQPSPPLTKRGKGDILDDKLLDEAVFDNIVDLLIEHLRPRGTRSIAKDSISSNFVEKIEKKETIDICDEKTRYEVYTPKKSSGFRPCSIKRLKDGVYTRFTIEVPGNVNHVVVTDLFHDSIYSISIRACQNVTSGSNITKCSSDQRSEHVTLPKPDADNVTGEIKFETSKNLNETNSLAWITWVPPSNPNTLIVSYNIRTTKPDDDKYWHDQCVTAKKFEADGRRYYIGVTGSFLVQVQAVPFNGVPGAWTSRIPINVEDKDRTQYLLTIILPIVIVLVAVVIGGVAFYAHKKNERDKARDGLEFNPNYMNMYSFPRIDRSLVEVGKHLGGGAFGEVHVGTYKSPDKGSYKVALKSLREKADANDRKLFLDEAEIMANLHSPHIVSLIGVVSSFGGPVYILLEMMHGGDLKVYLRDARPPEMNKRATHRTPTENELLQMAVEIADGMAYLSSRRTSIVHRDLAARNCLLTADHVVKVGDFGRARDIYKSDYYRQTFRGMVPVRWMPPEALRDGDYVSKSDVWSYGVVLWELATLAEEPYQGMPHDEVVRYIIDQDGHPELRPTFSLTLSGLMKMCWERDPEDRPSFMQICQILDQFSNQRFRECSFFHSPDCEVAHRLHNSKPPTNNRGSEGQGSLEHGTGNGGNLNDNEEMEPLCRPNSNNVQSGNTKSNERLDADSQANRAVTAAKELGSTPNATDGIIFRNSSIDFDLKRIWSSINKGTKQRRTHDSA